MPKQCPQCQSLYPNFVDFCVEDGHRLESVFEPLPALEHPTEDSDAGWTTAPSEVVSSPPIPGRARLIPKVHGQLQSTAFEFSGTVVLGRFDPQVGAVDIDLTDMPGQKHISPRHARLTFTDNRWYVEDLDSETGTFLDQNTRVDRPIPIESGQELALGNALFLFDADEL